PQAAPPVLPGGGGESRMKLMCSCRRLLAALAVLLAAATAFADSPPKLVSAARQQTTMAVTYDGSYTRIGYPMGDVPANRGVCTDVVVRAYRAIDIDLQVLVHEDMRAHFSSYPHHWGLS